MQYYDCSVASCGVDCGGVTWNRQPSMCHWQFFPLKSALHLLVLQGVADLAQ